MFNQQPELGLVEIPMADTQRWKRLIPEHFNTIFQRHGWTQLPLEELHEQLKINGRYPLAEDLILRIIAISERYLDDSNERLGDVFL